MTEPILMDEAKASLETLMGLLEINGSVSCSMAEESPVLSIASEESGRIIGKKGQSLEALELVLNRIVRKKHLEEDGLPWFILDVDGYHVSQPKREGEVREGREGHHSRLPKEEEERLQAMAQDIAREVKKIGKSRVIGPFSPAERRIIHVTLENDPEVETISEVEADEHRGKKITIQLKA